MKIDCKPRKADERNHNDNPVVKSWIWKQTLPFNVNPRGILVHRVRCGRSHFWYGKRSHDSVNYWCCNSVSGKGVNLTDAPPADRLLCAHCERLAVEAGEPTAEELAGHHVCIGVLKAFRLCCRNEGN